jgi:uncharacterized damage-inducible protein DinB
MNRTEYFLKMFAYDDWATRETLAALKSCDAPPTKSLKIMSHLISSRQAWMDRLGQVKQSLAFWPELNLQECESYLAEQSISCQQYLNGLDAADYSSQVSYVNSLGETWESSIEDILMHLLMHSSYHRGQIAFELRASGQTPPYTDFIHAVRQGFIKGPAEMEKKING